MVILNTQPSERELDQIASKVSDWQRLAIHLDIDTPTRESIEKDYKENHRQKIEMLLEWRRNKGSNATWKALVRASEEAKNKQLAEEINEICWMSRVNASP